MVASNHRPPNDRPNLERRGRRLEYGTVVWNSAEAVIAITTGLASKSMALVAFGLDSCVEVYASVVVLWYLGNHGESDDGLRTRRAMRLIAIAFFGLGIYLVSSAARGLVAQAVPGASLLGTAFMAATVAVMFGLAWGKRRTGVALGNHPLIANAAMTLLDGCLAAGIVVALVLDGAVGWWWADPLAAGAVGAVALNEARKSWGESRATRP